MQPFSVGFWGNARLLERTFGLLKTSILMTYPFSQEGGPGFGSVYFFYGV